MKNHSRILSILTLCALGVQAYAGAVKPSDDTYTFIPVAKVGDVMKMKTEAEIDFQGQSVSFSAINTATVKAIDDKILKIEQVQSDTHIVVGGNDIGSGGMGDTPVAFTFDSKGLLKEIVADNAALTSQEAYRAGALETFYVPDKAMKEGESWTYKYAADPKKWSATELTFTVGTTEKVKDWDCVKVKFTAKETGGTDAASEEGTLWLSVKDFSVVKKESKVVNFPIPGAPAPINGKFTSVRIS